jgi:hypothetical protein
MATRRASPSRKHRARGRTNPRPTAPQEAAAKIAISSAYVAYQRAALAYYKRHTHATEERLEKARDRWQDARRRALNMGLKGV